LSFLTAERKKVRTRGMEQPIEALRESYGDSVDMKLRSFSIQRFILYLTIISAFTGTLWLSIEAGPIQIFPYRILLILMWVLFVGTIFINHGSLNISHIKVKRYLQFFALWFAYAFFSIMWAEDQVAAFRNIIFLFTGISIIFFLVYFTYDLKINGWVKEGEVIRTQSARF